MSTAETEPSPAEPAGTTLPDIDAVAKRLHSEPTLVTHVPALASQTLSGRMYCVRGEIGDTRDDRYGNSYMDLCIAGAEGVTTLPTRLTRKNRNRVSRFLQTRGQTVEHFFRNGNYVTAAGDLAVSSRGEVYLDIVKVDFCSAYPGPILRRRLDQTEALVELGVSRADISRRYRHRRSDIPIPGFTRVRDVAVLTSNDSDALDDFTESVDRNIQYGDFELTHIPVQLEGDGAVGSITRALASLNGSETDVAVLIRGGGSWQSRTVFDDPDLARAILQCPVPVLTGIGHAKDVSVADRVAKASFTTPSQSGSALRTTVLHLNKAAKRADYRPERVRNNGGPRVSADAIGDYSRRRIDQLLRERDAVRAEERSATNAWKTVQSRYQGLLFSTGLERVDGRARVLTLVWALATIAALAVAHGADGAATPAVLAAGACAYAALFTWCGKHRARQPPKKRREYPSAEQWETAAARVRTPREFRRIWAW